MLVACSSYMMPSVRSVMAWRLPMQLAALIMALTPEAQAEYYFRKSFLKHLPSCRLGGGQFSESVSTSALRCKFTCLQHADCVALEWDAESGNCHIQDSLHIAPSSSSSSPAHHSVLLTMEQDLPLTCATDCADILAAEPSSESGLYYIFVAGQVLTQVWCDMDTDGGGWTVFVKRFDGSVDFYQDHAAYKEGFGDVSAEHWLGLDALHAMTSSKTYQMRADMSDWDDDTAYSLHASMLVADDAADYILTLGDFLGGEGGGYLLYNQGQRFSTYDHDVDAHSTTNCASRHSGGWWYKACSKCHVTSKYYTGGTYSSTRNDGIQFRSWSKHLNDYKYSLKTLELKLRP